jgi:hypothetical protein
MAVYLKSLRNCGIKTIHNNLILWNIETNMKVVP